MQLTPKLPPGRSSRKALRYVNEVRRLRAEGHTLESIRQALLDVGVSVSLSTVRREVARPPSMWELERAQEEPLALEELQPTGAAPGTTLWHQHLGADRDLPTDPAGAEPSLADIKAVGDRRSYSLLARVFGVLRRLCRTRQVP